MKILELTKTECVEMLARLKLGRLACVKDDQPYIMPIYYAYHERHLYSFAMLGRKINWMRANPHVCVEVDEILHRNEWISVIVQGQYEELLDTAKWKFVRELAHNLLQHQAMWWEPAYVKTDYHYTMEEIIPVYYRIHINEISGRCARPDPVPAIPLIEPPKPHLSKSRFKSLLHRLSSRPPGPHS